MPELAVITADFISPRSRIPPVGRLLHGGGDDRVDPRVAARAQTRGLEYSARHLVTKHFAGHDAGAVNSGAMIEVLAARLFRRHVMRRAHRSHLPAIRDSRGPAEWRRREESFPEQKPSRAGSLVAQRTANQRIRVKMRTAFGE